MLYNKNWQNIENISLNNDPNGGNVGFIYLFVCLFIYLFIYLFICKFILA